jgi:putative oxidoreductase
MIARSFAPGAGARVTGRSQQIFALLDRFPPSLLQLMFRIAIAAVFWSSGLTKVASWAATVALFRDEYKLPLLPPEVAAVTSATFELLCSALIALGLATRLATLPLLGMTFVIEVFVYPEYWAMHLMWTAALVLLLTKGPGVLSLDYYAERGFRTRF